MKPSAPAVRHDAAVPHHGAAWGMRGLTVLLARNGDAKARILSRWQQGLAAPIQPYPPNGSSTPALQALIIEPGDLGAGAAVGQSEQAAGAERTRAPERAARQAIESLRARAAALLVEDGSGGRIAELAAALHAIDGRIAAAKDAEAAQHAGIAALLEAAHVGIEIERDRDGILAERAQWLALRRLWPEWQRLQQARRDLDALGAFDHVPPDLGQRWAAAEHRELEGERAVRAARAVLSRLASERDELKQAEAIPAGVTNDALRLAAELGAYRPRLLELAAARARLAEGERGLSAALEHLERSDEAAQLADVDLTAARRDELLAWQERGHRAHATQADAEAALAAARTRVGDLCTQASRQLAGPPAPDENDLDARWRTLWILRAQLEELWNVQSRAESSARGLAEREEVVRRAAGVRHWAPPRWLLSPGFTVLAIVATAVWGSGVLRGLPAIAVAGLAILLISIRLALQARARWVRGVAYNRVDRDERLRRDIDTLRRRRDAAWSRAAKLNETIREAVARLSLAEPVTPEAVEACEHELAAQLRRAGGSRTALSSLLIDVLDAQDDEHREATRVAAAEGERRLVEREWEAWRTDAGFTYQGPLEPIGTWLEELGRLAAARSAVDAARRALDAVEPLTAAWEADARRVLRDAGVEIRPELCGSALAAELTDLAARAQRAAEQCEQRARVEAALPDAERLLADAEAGATAARTGRHELLNGAGCADGAALLALVEAAQRWREAREPVRRLQLWLDEAIAGTHAPDVIRAELAAGNPSRWDAALRDGDARLTDVHARLDGDARQRLAAEQCLDEARAAVELADLQLEREELVTALGEAAREWKLRVLAAALLESALDEYERAGRSELLEDASRTLATLTRGRYTGIARSEADKAGLSLVDREGRRVSIAAAELNGTLREHVQVSLLLGRAAQLARRGSALPFVLDDVLGPLPQDDAQLVGREIASLARAHPVYYLGTAAQRLHILSAMPGDVAVVEVE